jgi:hypothetical protein
MQESEFLLGFGGICDSEVVEMMRKDWAAVDICLYCLLDTSTPSSSQVIERGGRVKIKFVCP